MEYKEIIQSIRKKQYKPVYFLHGEEPYFIDAITAVIENEILDEGMKSFNQVVLYGKEVDAMTVIDNARRYPMMSPIQVVIVKEAQNMSTLAQLQKYIEAPLSSTVLLIAHKHKKIDGRSAFAKSLTKHAVLFESKPLYDNQIPDFIRNWLKEHKMTIANDAMDLMVEYLGTDLGKIINELEKLQLNLKNTEGGQITTEHIEKFIGISREYNVFELQKALGLRQILQANKIVNYFHENPKDAPFVMVIGTLYNYFSKIYQLSFLSNASPNEQTKTLGLRSDWFLKDYTAALRQYPRPKLEQVFALLREFDLKAKGVNADGVEEGELLKELVYKILH
ncbi:MAG: DNA polymerase III subunit delta [Saprospiraceae bacterium]|nr:DNA polymerase III subunit delta [Saprospiraceae bacterium]